MDWMAQMLQEPGKKMGSRSRAEERGEGHRQVNAGGDAPAHPRRPRLSVSKTNQLIGQFNAHLEHAILLGVEEAIWGGDRQAAGPLKNLITEPRIAIERKGVDAFLRGELHAAALHIQQ